MKLFSKIWRRLRPRVSARQYGQIVAELEYVRPGVYELRKAIGLPFTPNGADIYLPPMKITAVTGETVTAVRIVLKGYE